MEAKVCETLALIEGKPHIAAENDPFDDPVVPPSPRELHDDYGRKSLGCPYCMKDYRSASGLASHVCRDHPGKPAPLIPAKGGAI